MSQAWSISGDWFDLCKCDIPCPCNFGQSPTHGDCAGLLAWHIEKGHYGDEVRLDDLNVIMVGGFKGNLWDGSVSEMVGGFFIDERADAHQRKALATIFAGKAGGFPAQFAKMFSEVKGMEFVPIKFEVAKDLGNWSVEVPGKVTGMAEALSNLMMPPGMRMQSINTPENLIYTKTGVATWGKAAKCEIDAYGFRWNFAGKSSKHVPFEWSRQ